MFYKIFKLVSLREKPLGKTLLRLSEGSKRQFGNKFFVCPESIIILMKYYR